MHVEQSVKMMVLVTQLLENAFVPSTPTNISTAIAAQVVSTTEWLLVILVRYDCAFFINDTSRYISSQTYQLTL